MFAFALACAAPRPRPDLTTAGERSRFVRTGRYDETVRLCRDFARAYAGVRCEELGRTLQGRPLVALVIARRPGRPVVYFQGGIHAGEIDGKDAGFWLVRDLLDGKVAPGALDAVTVVFVPVVNPDGHERFGPNHRVNQRGPAEMGFRTNAARLNLNRDFIKLDAPETRAIVGAIRRFDPVVVIDLHATDGAKFEHDISVITAPVAPRGGALDEAAAALSRAVMARLTELGHLPVPFYPSFVEGDDPASGIEVGEAPPRFSQAYAAARGRLGVLVETHSWRPYVERVASTYHTLQIVLEQATRLAPAWRAAADAAARADRALGGADVTLAWKVDGAQRRDFAFRGYAYERRPSPISNDTWTVYDERTPQVWTVPLFERLVPDVTVRAPRGGYVVDGGYAALVAPLLDAHGIAYASATPAGPIEVEVFRATKASFAPPYEGRARVRLDGAWAPETRALDRGAIFVPIAQPLARLAMHLFEPAAPDALVAWGLFNTAFERKEYMEPYVAEEVARELLAADPALQAAFDAALAADPELAASSARRLEWFYRRHPSWDERLDLVPVYRVAAAPR